MLLYPLYHGTSEANWLKTVQDGKIVRRGVAKGNWAHSVQSNPRAVYLTDTYAPYFAASATQDEKDRAVILEVDGSLLDRGLFAPDEDFLEQATRSVNIEPQLRDCLHGKNTVERTMWFRSRAHSMFRHLWGLSLQKLGTVAYYGDIPMSAVTRVSLFHMPSNPVIWLTMLDPQISLWNHKLCSDFYKLLTKWFFENITAEEYDAATNAVEPSWHNSEVYKMLKERTGLTLLSNKGYPYTFAVSYFHAPRTVGSL